MILQFLLNYFLNEYGNGALKPLLTLLEQNNYDIKSLIKNAKLESLAPLISSFMSSASKGSQKVGDTAPSNKTIPIESFTDLEIVSTLNQYFSS